ncbi:MAG: diacylglycerol kinase family lipid kinase [Bacteroidales bacterium]|nr:diacylglycerol kinase family lipid kinase [Candidatus Cacconaster scatequi]
MYDWKVIISRKSGHGKAAEVWNRVSRFLELHGISFSATFTEYKYHAIEIARDAVLAGCSKLVAVGGDGTMHEVLSGIMSQDSVPSTRVTLAMIPVGSGNDWPRLHKVPCDPLEAASLIVEGHSMLQDVVRIESVLDGRPMVRHMINIGGLGYDSYVCHLFNSSREKGKGGGLRYLKCLVKGFMKYRCKDFTIKVDGHEFFRGPALSVALGNGRYCGGGMMQTPDAVCDDGILDITVIRSFWKPKFVFKLKKLYDGGIYSVKEVVHTTACKSIEILAEPKSLLEVDGESCGSTPVRAVMIPSAINVISALDRMR